MARRLLPWLVHASLSLLACGGAAAPRAAEPKALAGKGAPPDPEALAYDCRTLEEALASFTPPADDALDGTSIAKSYRGAAVTLRTVKLETADVRETSKAMADLFERIASNGSALESDFRALRVAAEHARERVGSFESSVVGAEMSCGATKGEEPACPEVTSVLASHPVLRRADTQDPTAFVTQLGAFRKDLASLKATDGKVRQMLEVVSQEASAVEKGLTDMQAARRSLDEHSFAGETKAISGRLDALCPAKKRPPEPAPP